jgi:hypothetical protein
MLMFHMHSFFVVVYHIKQMENQQAKNLHDIKQVNNKKFWELVMST